MRVLAVATWDEARKIGARQKLGRYVHEKTEDVFVSVAAGPRAIEGLRVSDIVATSAAMAHPNWPEVYEVLLRSKAKMPKAATEHDHSGPDWKCEACKPLADVLRDRMKWASMHWGALHDDAYASLARAIIESDWLHQHDRRVRVDPDRTRANL